MEFRRSFRYVESDLIESTVLISQIEKCQITKIPKVNIQSGKSFICWQNQNLKHTKRIENNYNIPNFYQAFPRK